MKKIKKDICAVVTTFQPKIFIIEKLKRVSRQVGLIILVDDTGLENTSISHDYSEITNLVKIDHTLNSGIARALNTGVEEAIRLGYHLILTLDDDTALDSDYVPTILDFLSSTEIKNVGLISCSRNDSYLSHESNSGYCVKRTLITSGSIFSAEVYRKCGGFDNELFIDLVDFDFCTKIRKIGFCLVRLNKCGMFHPVGDLTIRNFFNFKFFIYNHSPFRLYYQARNPFLFARKYFIFDPLLTIRIFLEIFKLPLKAIFFENEKSKRMRYITKGYIHGMTRKVGKIN